MILQIDQPGKGEIWDINPFSLRKNRECDEDMVEEIEEGVLCEALVHQNPSIK